MWAIALALAGTARLLALGQGVHLYSEFSSQLESSSERRRPC